ncbi:MAG: hypothetical protein FJ148_10980 [Deltaproteobacteria bacterium]|nr:hypothetical protein [Deltaproteobacteria bacterium]
MHPESSNRARSTRGRDCAQRRARTSPSPAAALAATVVVAITLLQACSFTAGQFQSPQDVYDILDESQYVEPYAGDRWTVVDDPKLRVEHGWACAAASSAASSEYIGLRVGGFTRLPSGFDGTVFLNGWHLEYQRTDHHVVGFGTSIFNIVQLNDVLVWNAGGVLSDKNGDDAYRWCYEYTTLAWARPEPSPIVLKPRVDIQAIHSDPQANLMYVDSVARDGVDKIPGSFRTTGKPPRGVLLAGFGSSYTDDDHHVLQIGFDLGKAKVRRKRIKWKSDVVFRDNNGDDGTRSASIVSVLTGDSVNVFHPAGARVEGGDAPVGYVSNDLELAARSGGSGIVGACLGSPAERTVEMAIVTPPFTWAIPMLTGWDLGSPCRDNHLTHVGAWIEDFRYVRVPGESNGTLYYTIKTNFGDKDDIPGMLDRVQVDVLGINLLQSPGLDPGAGRPAPGPRKPGPFAP